MMSELTVLPAARDSLSSLIKYENSMDLDCATSLKHNEPIFQSHLKDISPQRECENENVNMDRSPVDIRVYKGRDILRNSNDSYANCLNQVPVVHKTWSSGVLSEYPYTSSNTLMEYHRKVESLSIIPNAVGVEKGVLSGCKVYPEGKRMRDGCELQLSLDIGTDLRAAEPKRPRDLSPNITMPVNTRKSIEALRGGRSGMCSTRSEGDMKQSICGRKHLSDTATGHHSNSKKQVLCKTDIKELEELDDTDATSVATESEDDSVDCDAHRLGDEEQCTEDDQMSVVSNSASIVSTSLVGETLGAITLEPHIVKDQETNDALEALRPSLFSHMPPCINFCMYNEKVKVLPWDVRKHLKWKMSNITPIVVKQTLLNSGFRLIRSSPNTSETSEWGGTWGKHMKSFCFKTLKDYQKLNHFPGTFQIGRKDRLWKNLQRLMATYGKEEFGFIPRTYILPHDTKLLRQAWEGQDGQQRWIIKPPASARGAGIKVVHRWSQVPKKRPLIVQKYVGRPYLINGSKFDLRLYVLVTSMNPLRIYIYEDGLVRFASVKYSPETKSLSDRYMHLTNYSINKSSSLYTHNEDASACQGHKWTIKSLWRYLETKHVDTDKLWYSLVDMVIKTFISADTSICSLTYSNVGSRYCCYELFGFDVIFDENLKPWLLEVNISPSLHSASPLDLSVKGPMVRDLLNIARFHIPNKIHYSQQNEIVKSLKFGKKISSLCLDKRLYNLTLPRDTKLKQMLIQANPDRNVYLGNILHNLTSDDVRYLIQAEDELAVAGSFSCIFPTRTTHWYFQFFDSVKYYNMLFDAWETKYSRNRKAGIALLESLCKKRFHLQVPPPALKPKSCAGATSQGRQGNNPGEEENIDADADVAMSPVDVHPDHTTTEVN